MTRITSRKSLEDYRINPDGVDFSIKWEAFKPGASFFIPCINTVKAAMQVIEVANFFNWQIDGSVRIEDGRLGIRFWRRV